MIKSGLTPRLAIIGAKIQSFARWKWFFSLAIALLVTVAATPEPSQNPDEQYIQIMALIDKADALRKAGQADAAKAKYVQAEKALLYFKAVNPLYSPRAVAYRLKEVSDYADARPPITEPTPTPSKPKTNLESTAGATAKNGVKLLEPGAEPRNQLRLHVKAGDKQTMIMTVNVNMDMSMPGAGKGAPAPATTKIPTMSIPMDMTVQSVAANGDINYQAVIGEPAVADEPGVAPQMMQAMKTAISGIKGMTATGILSNRGISKKADITAPNTADPQVTQTADQIKEGMSNLGARLPEEAVGPGAKWEIKRPIKTQGITTEQTETYELVSAEGDHLNMKFTVEQDASNQKMQNPAMKGAEVNLIKLTTTGSGTSESDLSKLMPTKATMDMHMEMNAEINANNKKMPMGMKMDMNMSLESH
jgi:hypothetical protein